MIKLVPADGVIIGAMKGLSRTQSLRYLSSAIPFDAIHSTKKMLISVPDGK